MEGKKIVPCGDSIKLIIQQGSGDTEDRIMLVNTPEKVACEQMKNANSQSDSEDVLRSKHDRSLASSSMDEEPINEITANSSREVDTAGLQKEIDTLKIAVTSLVEAFLRNKKLSGGVGTTPDFDKSSTSSMVNILRRVTKYILNYSRVESMMKDMQKGLNESNKINTHLFDSRKVLNGKLEELSQSTGLEDILSQLRTIFRETGVKPGPLFKVRSEESVTDDVKDSLLTHYNQRQVHDNMIEEVLYKIDFDEEKYGGVSIREDGTFDDSDVELADYDEDDDVDLALVKAELDAGSVLMNGDDDDDENTEDASASPGSKRYSLRPKKPRLAFKLKRGRPRREELRMHECCHCGKLFEKKSSLRDHIRLHTGEKPFVCDICGESFRVVTYLNEHRRKHTGEKPYECNLCGKKFRKGKDMWDHKKIHDKRFPCSYCGKLFPQRKYLVNHERTHTGEKPFHCTICDTWFSLKHSLQSHRRKVHKVDDKGNPCEPKAKKNATCEICNKVVRLYGLKEHMAIHATHRPYKCDFCDKSFVQKQALTFHVKRIHENIRNFTCNLCGKAFVRGGDLNVHMKRHDKDYSAQALTCSECGKVLCNEDALQQHMATHSGVKSEKCDRCDRAFYTQRSLRDHIRRIHEGRTYQCDVCGRRLASFSGLRNHKLIHTGEKPYACEICGSSFRKMDTLKSHAKAVHHKKTALYHCGVCGDVFTNQTEMYNHRSKCDSTVFVLEEDSDSETI